MLPLKAIEDYDTFYRYLEIDTLDDVQIPTAKARFTIYRDNGVILNKAFDDDVWKVTNEVKKHYIHFEIDKEKFREGAGKWIGIRPDRMKVLIKTYFCILLGELDLSHLSVIVNQLRHMAYMNEEDLGELKELTHVITFLKLLPGESRSRDRVIEDLEESEQIKRWKQGRSRKLLDFQAYLRFDKALKDYWSSAGEDDKVFYFPIYFWWTLTAILPLRPTELLLTPADCIRRKKRQYILTVRRTLLKKRRKRLTYRIDTDYELKEYEIPEWFAREILDYKNRAHVPEKGMLLQPSTFAKSDYLTYAQVESKLKRFLKNAVGMPDMAIHVGDTRHLAMINLILSGGSPTICKELAGHESIDISSNYYANLSTVIESAVYQYCHQEEEGAVLAGTLNFPSELPADKIRLSEGWCCYTPVSSGDISECLKNYKRGHELGDCRFCLHYIPDQRGLQMKILKERKTNVDQSCEYLIQMIDMVRSGNGSEENIASALARLQNDAYSYTCVLLMKDKEGK